MSPFVPIDVVKDNIEAWFNAPEWGVAQGIVRKEIERAYASMKTALRKPTGEDVKEACRQDGRIEGLQWIVRNLKKEMVALLEAEGTEKIDAKALDALATNA